MPDDDFFAAQSPEEQAIIDASFSSEKPPKDIVVVPPAKVEETPAKPVEVKKEEPATPAIPEKKVDEKPPEAPAATDRQPVPAVDEPAWRVNLRKKLIDARTAKRAAQTPEQKATADAEIASAQRDLATNDRVRGYKPSQEDIDVLSQYKDPTLLENDKNRVRALGKDAGLATRDDVREEIRDVISQEREISTRNQTLKDFFKDYPEVYDNPENRELFFETVENYSQYQGKDADELRFIFESTHAGLFPDDFETKLAKSQKLKDKMDAVQFNGGSAAAAAKPKDPEKERLKKEFSDKGEDVSWFLDD